MKALALLTATLLIHVEVIFSQDTIVTLDGDKIAASDYIVDEATFEIEYKTPTLKTRSILGEDVFSIVNKDGTERVFYKYDPAEGNGLEVEDMREMVNGMSSARINHREPLMFFTGVCAGIGGVYLMPTVGGNLMYAPLVPLLAISIAGISNVNADARTQKLYGKSMSQMFNSGYADRAKRKRMSTIIFGSITGLAGGVLLHSISGDL